MVKTSYIETELGVWQTLPQKVKGSRPQFGYGQAVKAKFERSKFLTAVAGGTTWSIYSSDHPLFKYDCVSAAAILGFVLDTELHYSEH